ncbi:AfsR/SARP family transcriptional regulator [Pseudonocardia endophytica]|uniref:DNA-binding SARP family transcriptional activator n=1 Tax=Pseudonocardia endophytica TaxID=401976 RepID=A0A4R1HM62_PSEEN|nr:AfsR/SARP family transcriptional regulator [Pseudonocardia endophytica]TCK22201.1 DNA-binding SARP family transcriptional activator [Pseudonocardia endophytica]
MFVDMLGTLTVRAEDGSDITPSAGKPRQVLATLAASPGQVVTVDTLVEELWGEQPVRSAATTIQTYVMQLRRLIAGTTTGSRAERSARAKDVLQTCHTGYRLAVEPTVVDLTRFLERAESGRRAADLGDDAGAAEILRDALDLWRGPVLIDVNTGPVLRLETTRMDEHRLTVLETCIDAEIRLGRHTGLLAELTTLCGRHPMHEGLAARLMLALHRSGRSSEAMRVFATLRRHLVDELAIEPSAPVQRLHSGILDGDPALDLPDAAVAA